MARSNLIALDEKRLSKRIQKATRQGKFLTTKQLIKASTVDFSKAKTSKDRLVLCLKVIEGTIPIAEGLFRLRPSHPHSYALGSLIDRLQSLTDQIESKIDYKDVAERCVQEVIHPVIESLVLELGKTIRVELGSLGETLKMKDKRKVKESLDSIYRSYGKLTQKETKKLSKELLRFLKRR